MLMPVLFTSASSPRTVFSLVKQPCWQTARACGESAKQRSARPKESKPCPTCAGAIEFCAIGIVVFDLNKVMVVVFCSLMVDPVTLLRSESGGKRRERAFRTQPRIQIFGLKLKPRQLGKIKLWRWRYSFRSASLNGMMRSTAPRELRIRISPERKHARPSA